MEIRGLRGSGEAGVGILPRSEALQVLTRQMFCVTDRMEASLLRKQMASGGLSSADDTEVSTTQGLERGSVFCPASQFKKSWPKTVRGKVLATCKVQGVKSPSSWLCLFLGNLKLPI